MPFLPGYVAMPTTLLNALLGLSEDRELVVRGPDRLAAVAPMFDEEEGAGPALASLLAQTHPLDELVVSINGGRDRTPQVVAATLLRAGYRLEGRERVRHLEVVVDRWVGPDPLPVVQVLDHAVPTSKADSVNFAVAGGYLRAERVLIVDGDTRFHPDFVGRVRDGFYRLRRERRDGRPVLVLDEVGVQSGAVDSLRPGPGRPLAAAISRARSGEYALATLLRAGQTRLLGRGPVFGSTRMFTAVGCGFVVRREAFPMPTDTWTEDHDFTLLVQNERDVKRSGETAALHQRGFRAVVADREMPLRALADRDDALVIRRTSGARFVSDALMYTEDPPSVGGYLRQVERWHGGGIENALKRTLTPGAWRTLRGNVRFAVAAAQLENLLGLLFLLAVPMALGLYVGAPGIGGFGLAGLGTWMVLDLLATFLLVTVGARRLERARGHAGPALAARSAGVAIAGVPPLLALRLVNVVGLLTAALRIVPGFSARQHASRAVSRTWVRARVRRSRRSYRRYLAVSLGLLALAAVNLEATRRFAIYTWPDDRTVSAIIADAPTIDKDEHRHLPLAPPSPAEPIFDDEADDAEPRASAPSNATRPVRIGLGPLGVYGAVLASGWAQAGGPEPAEGSSFCRPSQLPDPAEPPRRLGDGAPPYRPLTSWGLLTLARLAPLLDVLEEAATAYDLPPELLLKVLLNESYLDPLAVGPTEDLGLSQMTTETLTLIGALAGDPASPFANAQLMPDGFSVFDPAFSMCAGAALLAWSRSQPGGDDQAIAYARYVNPRHGVVRGGVSERHRPLVDAFLATGPMVDALASTVAAYRADPATVTPSERELLEVADAVASDRVDIGEGYARVARLAAELGIDDRAFYREVLTRLFGRDDDLGARPGVPRA